MRVPHAFIVSSDDDNDNDLCSFLFPSVSLSLSCGLSDRGHGLFLSEERDLISSRILVGATSDCHSFIVSASPSSLRLICLACFALPSVDVSLSLSSTLFQPHPLFTNNKNHKRNNIVFLVLFLSCFSYSFVILFLVSGDDVFLFLVHLGLPLSFLTFSRVMLERE